MRHYATPPASHSLSLYIYTLSANVFVYVHIKSVAYRARSFSHFHKTRIKAAIITLVWAPLIYASVSATHTPLPTPHHGVLKVASNGAYA